MEAKDTEQTSESDRREDDRNEEIEGSPIPDPEAERGTAQDDPGAD
jgi:hypothetical protein